MRAIILAAGKGERLYPLTKYTPKCLLQISNKQCILGHQVELFRENGIEEIVVVVGYLANKVEKFLDSFSGVQITTIYNPFYNISNSIVSCWLAMEYMNDDFFLVNGDTVICDTVVKEMLKSSHSICLAVSNREKYGHDEMKVILDTSNELVTDVRKSIPTDHADGVSLGFFVFQNKSGLIYKKKIEEMFRIKENLHVFHHNVIRQMIKDKIEVKYQMVDSNLWAEVDLLLDLEMLRSNINISFINEK